MIVSVHIADPGPRAAFSILRRPPRPKSVAGLTYAAAVTTAPLGAGLLPRPRPGRVGLIAAWEDDDALDRFASEQAAGRSLASGWEVRMQPIHLFGSWAGMPELPREPLPQEEDEPVGVLTLGWLRLNRAVPFLRSAAAAEAAVAGNPALLAGSGLARPPHFFSTFSLWRSAREMKAYAFGESGAHQAAVRADRERAYHHESAFVRFRPYSSRGSWDGRDPLACRRAAS